MFGLEKMPYDQIGNVIAIQSIRRIEDDIQQYLGSSRQNR
jgi:hypothetical protein